MNQWEWQLLEEKTPLERLAIGDAEVRVGSRVRLHPKPGGDVLDMALAEQTATVESLEQDYEGHNHVCVVLENDPGRDLGLLRQPGHRFFFTADEIEPLGDQPVEPVQTASVPRILIAGIGNIFLGDDGFGVEVVRRLPAHSFPADVRVVDFGIRGLDLAYALQDGYETTILIDAYPHGQRPGAVSLVEPDLNNLGKTEPAVVEAHSMNPLNVLRMAAAMNGKLKDVLLVGCEPETLGGEDGCVGLSPSVASAVDEAVELVCTTVRKLLQEKS
jgi:hydrogenase maturation protease